MGGIVIALHGARGAGKDTLADYLESRFGFIKIAFADALRESCAKAWGVPIDIFTARGLKDKPNSSLLINECLDRGFYEWVVTHPETNRGTFSQQTPRKILQQYSDYIKSIHGKYYYCLKLQRLLLDNTHRNYVVSDCRYHQEAAMIDDLARETLFSDTRVYKVSRGDLNNPVDTHSSEIVLSDAILDGEIFNTGSKFEFCSNATRVICNNSPEFKKLARSIVENELSEINSLIVDTSKKESLI